MKTKFIFGFSLLALTACGRAGTSGPDQAASGGTFSQDGGDGQRLVSLIDYVSADYAGAVANGQVISAFEYEEQLGFMDTALVLVPERLETTRIVGPFPRVWRRFETRFEGRPKPESSLHLAERLETKSCPD